MTKKRIIGLCLTAVGVILLAVVVLSIGQYMPHEGPWIGKITQYHPPYPAHGLQMAALGIVAAVSFLVGIILMADRR